MYCVYILYSSQIDKFYIGQTIDLENRISEHNNGIHDKSFTKRANDWTLFLKIECNSISQAIKIEKHIKKMKNRKYLEDLKRYPEMIENLKIKYS